MSLVSAALADRARRPWADMRGVVAALGAPRHLAAQAADTARGLAAFSGLARAPEPSALNGPLGPHRSWGWARADLSGRPRDPPRAR